MANVVMSRGQRGMALPAFRNGALRRVQQINQTYAVKPLICYTFYAFVFSLPFEESYLAGGTTLSKFLGLALAAFACLQLRLCYAFPPRAFWWFVIYLFIYVLWGGYLILVPPNVPEFNTSFISSVFKLTQLLVLFWISYNLMKREDVSSGALWALAGGTMLLAILQILGITGEVTKQGRMTAFSEQNPNSLATVLALGLLALAGLAYGREKYDWKGRLLFWVGSGIIAIAIVQTGSRGAVVALIGSLAVFFLRGKSLGTKLKFGIIGLAGIIVLAFASYYSEGARIRWEKTFYDEDVAGRDKIYAQSIDMVLESPLIGWGPINHLWELGPRVGKPNRDEHNIYLWILAEVGLLGAIPFFGGLRLCWTGAWRVRHSSQGILPLAMLLFLLVAGMKGTLHKQKYFWLVLSLSLAAASYTRGSPQYRSAVPVRLRRKNAFGRMVVAQNPSRPLRAKHHRVRHR